MNEKEFYMEQQKTQLEEFLLEKQKFDETMKLEKQKRDELNTQNNVFDRRNR